MPVVPLQCPLCGGLIQIDTALAGRQVGCPLCQSPIALPPTEQIAPPGDVVQLACPVCEGPFQASVGMAGQQVGCPHCGSAVGIPPLEPAPKPIEHEVAPSLPTPPPQRPPAGDRLPPGMTPRPKPAAATAHSADRLPPSRDVTEQRAERIADVEALLPPGAKSPTARPTRPIDDLLPPGAATGESAAASPSEPQHRPLKPVQLPPGAAAAPTDDGGFVALREKPRTIIHGSEEIELVSLSREEKARRRFRRNLVLWGVCLAILFGVLVVMMW